MCITVQFTSLLVFRARFGGLKRALKLALVDQVIVRQEELENIPTILLDLIE